MEIKPTNEVVAETQPVTAVDKSITDAGLPMPGLSTTPVDALDIFGLGGKASDIINQHAKEKQSKHDSQFETIVNLDESTLAMNKPGKLLKVKVLDESGKVVDKPTKAKTETVPVVESVKPTEVEIDPTTGKEPVAVETPVVPAETEVKPVETPAEVVPPTTVLPTEEAERELLFNRLASTGNLSGLDEKQATEFFGWRTAKDKAIIDTHLPNIIADAEALGQDLSEDEMDNLLAGGKEAIKTFKTVLARNIGISATVAARALVPQITNQMQALNQLLNPIFQQHVQVERAVAEHEFFSNYPQFSETVDLGEGKGKVSYSEIVHSTAEQLARDPKNNGLTREQYFAKVAETASQNLAKFGINVAHVKGSNPAVQQAVAPVQRQHSAIPPTPEVIRPPQHTTMVRPPGSTSVAAVAAATGRGNKTLAQSLI